MYGFAIYDTGYIAPTMMYDISSVLKSLHDAVTELRSRECTDFSTSLTRMIFQACFSNLSLTWS